MSEVVGKDCNGKEIRTGDRVLIIGGHHSVKQYRIGAEETVVRNADNSERFFCAMFTDVNPNSLIVLTDAAVSTGETVMPDQCTLLINSGRELFQKCEEQAKSKPTEQQVRQAMPWTEGET